MKLKWDEEAWSDYLYWQTQDKKTLKRINASRRIDETNRVVYKIEDDAVVIAAVRGHYDD